MLLLRLLRLLCCIWPCGHLCFCLSCALPGKLLPLLPLLHAWCAARQVRACACQQYGKGTEQAAGVVACSCWWVCLAARHLRAGCCAAAHAHMCVLAFAPPDLCLT